MVVPAGPVALDISRFPSDDNHPGLVGLGWRLGWEMRLVRQGGDLTVLEVAGQRVPFQGGHGPTGTTLTLQPDGRGEMVHGDGSRDRFDSQGRLVERDLRNGNRIRLTWQPSGALSRIDGPYGATITLEYDDQGRIVGADSADGRRLRYTYRDGALAEVADAYGRTTRYAYRQSRLASVETAGAGTTHLAYDAEGRVTDRQWPDGRADRYEFGPNRVRHIDAGGGVTVYQWSDDRRREEITEPGGAKSIIDYDEAGRVRRVTGPTGNAAETAYDALGRVSEMTGSDGRRLRFTYVGETTLQASISEGSDRIRSFEYDANGNLILVRVDDVVVATTTWRPDGQPARLALRGAAAREFTYDNRGRLTVVSAEGGGATRFEYDDHGNPVREVNPLGGVTTRAFDGFGRMISEAAPNGAVTRYQYDRLGRLAGVISPLGERTGYQYDSAGHQVAVVDPAGRSERLTADGHAVIRHLPDGSQERLIFDTAGRLVEETDRLGRVSGYAYDALGRLTAERLPGGREMRYRFDDRLAAIEDSGGGRTGFAFDAEGRVIAETGPAGAVTRFEYDARDRMTARIDPEGGRWRFGYDDGDRLSEALSPTGARATFRYDADGRLTEVQHPGGAVTRYAHDAQGNITAVRGAAGEIRYGYDKVGDRVAIGEARLDYDAGGRLVRRVQPDGRTVTFGYDGEDRLVAADDGALAVAYGYDPSGNLIAVSYPRLGHTLRLERDALGLPQRLLAGGQELHYRYDKQKRMTAVVLPRGGEITLAYDPAGRIREIHYPNGVVGTWRYDAAGAVARVGYTGPRGALASWEYQRDREGKIVSAGGRGYGYDGDGRLVRDGDAHYTYDADGNRTRRAAAGTTVEYRYQAGQLTTAGDERFRHDAGGRMVGRETPRGATRYSYDAEGRLTGATTPAGEVRLGYLPTGERAWREDAQGRRHFVYLGEDLVEILDAQGKTQTVLVHGPMLDQPLARIDGDTVRFFHPDGLDGVALVTDQAGTALAQPTDAFGVPLTGNIVGPFLLAAREYDAGLGLYYHQARWYDPRLGRYLTPDPVPPVAGEPQSLNAYVYALNAPTRWQDPTGLAPVYVTPDKVPWGRIPFNVGTWLDKGLSKQDMLTLIYRTMDKARSDPSYLRGWNGPAQSREALQKMAATVVQRVLQQTAKTGLTGSNLIEAARSRLESPQPVPRIKVTTPPPPPPPAAGGGGAAGGSGAAGAGSGSGSSGGSGGGTPPRGPSASSFQPRGGWWQSAATGIKTTLSSGFWGGVTGAVTGGVVCLLTGQKDCGEKVAIGAVAGAGVGVAGTGLTALGTWLGGTAGVILPRVLPGASVIATAVSVGAATVEGYGTVKALGGASRAEAAAGAQFATPQGKPGPALVLASDTLMAAREEIVDAVNAYKTKLQEVESQGQALKAVATADPRTLFGPGGPMPLKIGAADLVRLDRDCAQAKRNLERMEALMQAIDAPAKEAVDNMKGSPETPQAAGEMQQALARLKTIEKQVAELIAADRGLADLHTALGAGLDGLSEIEEAQQDLGARVAALNAYLKADAEATSAAQAVAAKVAAFDARKQEVLAYLQRMSGLAAPEHHGLIRAKVAEIEAIDGPDAKLAPPSTDPSLAAKARQSVADGLDLVRHDTASCDGLTRDAIRERREDVLIRAEVTVETLRTMFGSRMQRIADLRRIADDILKTGQRKTGEARQVGDPQTEQQVKDLADKARLIDQRLEQETTEITPKIDGSLAASEVRIDELQKGQRWD